MKKRGIGEDGFPAESGIYLAKGIYGIEEPEEIEVYEYPIKGLCCWGEDYDYDETNGDINVQCTGLEFITKLRNLD